MSFPQTGPDASLLWLELDAATDKLLLPVLVALETACAELVSTDAALLATVMLEETLPEELSAPELEELLATVSAELVVLPLPDVEEIPPPPLLASPSTSVLLVLLATELSCAPLDVLLEDATLLEEELTT